MFMILCFAGFALQQSVLFCFSYCWV